MTESNREHLSCLMDGELERSAQNFLLRRLSGDPDMTHAWRRYHLVRACLHQEMGSGICIADRVSQAVAEEDDPISESRMPAWLRPVAGSAIAASVALVAIVGINSSLLERGQPELVAEQPGFVSQSSALDQTFSRQAIPVGFSPASEADRTRINTFVLRHNQAVGGGGFVSYLPIVTGTPVEAAAASLDEAEQDSIEPGQ
jgi:sigma-E factor negative regulatory protein RseA